MESVTVFFDGIVVPEGHRDIDGPTVDVLAESIKTVGLLHPIKVYLIEDTPYLISGTHRIAAMVRLGWDHTDADVLDQDEVLNRLVTIDENLCRAELTAMEESELTSEKSDLLKALDNTVPNWDTLGKKPGAPKEAGSVRDTAEATGQTKSSTGRAKKRAGNIAPDVKEAIKNTPAADIGVELDALASLTHDEQRQAVERVETIPDETFRKAREFIRDEDTEDETHRKQMTALRRAWTKVDDRARGEFLAEIRGWKAKAA